MTARTPMALEAARASDVSRSRRAREVRATTVSVNRMPKRELELGRLLYPEGENQYRRPLTRGECAGGARPCPFVGCRFNLFLDVHPKTGSIKFNFPDLEPEQLEQSCALDIADAGGVRLEDAGRALNVTRERIRQLEMKALAKMARAGARIAVLREYSDEGPVGKRRLPVLQEGGR